MAQKELSPEAWALLGFILRHTHGGPPAPDQTSAAFADAYAMLIAEGLIEHNSVRNMWVITDDGDRLLRARYADGG